MIVLILIPLASCSEKPTTPKATQAEIAAKEQKSFDEDNKERYVLISAKYELSETLVADIINNYTKKHSFRLISNSDNTNIDATLNEISTQTKIPKKIVAMVVFDYKLLNSTGE
jgi:hypothetical protein